VDWDVDWHGAVQLQKGQWCSDQNDMKKMSLRFDIKFVLLVKGLPS
jgi:hypothetical protein